MTARLFVELALVPRHATERSILEVLMTDTFDVAIVIGRFQPLHNGHLALIKEALRIASRAVVVVGSAHFARSARNPFIEQEREQMILGALGGKERARVRILPMRDYYDGPRWRRVLMKRVTELAGDTARVAVVGHLKDGSSDYLREVEPWRLVQLALQGRVRATPLREAYFSMGSDFAITADSTTLDCVPESTARRLAEFRTTAEYLALVEEQRVLKEYRQSWSVAPFPPVFVTVDAVVTCRDHVLLIQRGRSPGKGLWAIPGGFLEQADTLLQSALRELHEETGLVFQIGESAQLVSTRVFDHPQRSQRGRTITHAFHFELRATRLPMLSAGDDAGALDWVPVARLESLEDQLFDDHFHILDTFLGILTD